MDSKKSPKVALQVSLDRDNIEYASNGTVVLSFDAGWDSSAHSSLFLDRTTAPGHRVLLEVSWTLQIEGCPEPVPFQMDIGLAIQDRDTKRPSKLFELFSSARSSHKATQMYQVRLTPAVTNKSGDLWRVNTASVFVRSEEILEAWKPRGVSIVDDYYNLVKTENALAEVAGTEAILAAMPAYKFLPASAGEDTDEKLRKALHLWQKKFGVQHEVGLRSFFQLLADEDVCSPRSSW
jgi:kinesin family protein 1